tara:strand:+ start:1033 stop:1539 length:507 start_codon:yes stop_codon:yes gene_type:complete
MKIRIRNNLKNPSKVFWYCKVCKGRREEWKSKQKYSTYPFCSSSCKTKFYRSHPFDKKPNSYRPFFGQERFKIWLHNQISIFSPQFTSIRQDHSFRKLVRDEMWAMRKELNLQEAIYFIVFMMIQHNIAFIQDKQLYSKVYGAHIATMLLQDIPDTDYLEEAQKLLEE